MNKVVAFILNKFWMLDIVVMLMIFKETIYKIHDYLLLNIEGFESETFIHTH